MYIFKTNLSEFSAAHRMYHWLNDTCKNLHGHNFTLSVAFGAEKLNEKDIIVDYFDVDKHFNGWIKSNLDHGTIVCESDKKLIEFLETNKQKYYVMPKDKNPTVECIAEHVFHKFTEISATHTSSFCKGFKIIEVELWETKTSGAIYREDTAIINGKPCS